MVSERIQEERKIAREELTGTINPNSDMRNSWDYSQPNETTGLSLDALTTWRRIESAHILFEDGFEGEERITEEQFLKMISEVPLYMDYLGKDHEKRRKDLLERKGASPGDENERILEKVFREELQGINQRYVDLYDRVVRAYNNLPIEAKRCRGAHSPYHSLCNQIIKGRIDELEKI